MCTTWLAENKHFYLLAVDRGRWNYPDLKQRALVLSDRHRPTKILVEDANTGTALVAELRQKGLTIIGIKPERD